MLDGFRAALAFAGFTEVMQVVTTNPLFFWLLATSTSILTTFWLRLGRLTALARLGVDGILLGATFFAPLYAVPDSVLAGMVTPLLAARIGAGHSTRGSHRPGHCHR